MPERTKESFNADEILSRVEVSKLGKATASHQVDIRDVIASGELTEEKRKEIMKAIVEKHMMESAKLESGLRQAEIKEINEVLEDIQNKKEKVAARLKDELKEKLRSASEEEREDIILEYAKKLQDETNAIHNEKQRRLKDKRAKLKQERMNRRRELMRYVDN